MVASYWSLAEWKFTMSESNAFRYATDWELTRRSALKYQTSGTINLLVDELRRRWPDYGFETTLNKDGSWQLGVFGRIRHP
jgi:hypothetical protein